MKILKQHSHCKGFALIEGLIAAIVLGFGLIVVAKMQGGLIAGSGLAKSRSEAVQLAQQQMETLRLNIAKSDYEAMVDDYETIAGTNASFTRSWDVDNTLTAPNRTDLVVSVAWNDPKLGDQTVSINSTIIWDNPGAVASATNHAAFDNTGAIPDPTGGGELNDDPNETRSPGGGIDNGDGTYTLETADGDFELVKSTGELLLTAGTQFIRLTGTIFLDSTNTPNQFSNTNLTDLVPIASDAGVCLLLTPGATSVDFNCYVGGLWFGRNGVLAVEQSGGSDVLVRVADYGTGNKDILCPNTYQYTSNYEVIHASNYVPVVNEGRQGDLTQHNFVVSGASSCGYSISGSITAAGGVNITATASADAIFCTATSSSYTCFVPDGWNGTVTITGDNCTSDSTSYTNVTANTFDSYTLSCSTGLTISGIVTPSGTSGITVTPSSGATCSGTQSYSCDVPDTWTGSITVQAHDCADETVSFSNVSSDQTQNFALTCSADDDDDAPVVAFTSPAENTEVAQGSAFYVYWTISDDEDSDELTASYSDNISISFGGQQSPSLLGSHQTNGVVWQQAFYAPSGNNKSFWITITVTDNDGAVTEVTLNLTT